jgi:hypothetical protein
MPATPNFTFDIGWVQFTVSGEVFSKAKAMANLLPCYHSLMGIDVTFIIRMRALRVCMAKGRLRRKS